MVVRDVMRKFLRIRLRRGEETRAVEGTPPSCFVDIFLSTKRNTIVDNLAKFVHKPTDEADNGAEIVSDDEAAPR